MFTLRPLTIVLPSREDKDHPAIDLDLHLPFFCFRPQQLLQVLDTPLLCQCWWNRLTVTLMSLFSLCPFFCPRLCRCFLVCCRNSELCYFLLIGPDSHWLQSACCFFCRSVGIIIVLNILFKLLLLDLTYNNMSNLLLSNQSTFSLLCYLNNTQTLALNTQCYIVCGCLSEE